MSASRRGAGVRFVTVTLVTWTGLGAVAWLGARSLPGSDVGSRLGAWALGLLGVTVLGSGLERLIAGRLPPSDSAALAVDAALLWALASAVGWGIDVRVGGGLSGLATARFVARGQLQARSIRWRSTALLAALGGASAILFGDASDPARALSGLGGVLAGTVLGLAGTSRTAIRGAVLLVVVWAIAWLGAYYATGRMPMPDLAGYGGTGAEVVLAFLVGGIITGAIVGRSRVALALALAGIGAVILAIAGDLVLRFVRATLTDPSAWSKSHLAITQTIGMGIAAACAAAWCAPLAGQAVDGGEEFKYELGSRP